ncbi:MAG: hypothetical protein RLZZ519_3445, partial [Bacteroidota bacterium]
LRSFSYQHVHSLRRGSYGRVEYRNECAWEGYPKDKIQKASAILRVDDIEVMMQALQSFTHSMMRRDAGDINDERHRLSSAIREILLGSGLAFEEELLAQMPNVLSFSQKFIMSLMAERQYLPAYQPILSLQAATKRISVKKKCQETLEILGFGDS